MKAQSAIEFLSTYGFLFIVLVVVIAFILFFASGAQSTLTAQCSGFGGFTCSYTSYYSNLTSGYSVATFSLINSQTVPLNISSFSMTLGTTTTNGLCTPTFVYPGSASVCLVPTNGITALGTFLKGYYSVGANYCSSGIGELPLNNCTQQPVTYVGAFLTQVTPVQSEVFGVIIGINSSATASPPAYGLLNPPYLPANYMLAQNGNWNASGISGSVAYSFSTGGYVGANYLGTNAMPFPYADSMLNTVASCYTSPYSQLVSIASTTIYVYNTQNLERIETANAMAVFYKGGGALTWNSLYGSSSWPGNGLASYSASAALTPGLYSVDAVWYTPCGQNLQVLNIS